MNPVTFDADQERRFGGIARLYGSAALARLSALHIAVVGIGGVGSWAAEALARSGVGRLTLIDFDHIAESNINRQIHALSSTLGASKVAVMAQRIREINPACGVQVIDDFMTPDNQAQLLQGVDAVIDAIDQIRSKTALAAYCHAAQLPLMLCGGAGGKTDATQLTVSDLALSTNDPLLAKVRAQLRKQHGFPAGNSRGKTQGKVQRFGLSSIFINQAPAALPAAAQCAPGSALNCAGYGSAVHVTAVLGLAAAGELLNRLLK